MLTDSYVTFTRLQEQSLYESQPMADFHKRLNVSKRLGDPLTVISLSSGSLCSVEHTRVLKVCRFEEVVYDQTIRSIVFDRNPQYRTNSYSWQFIEQLAM